VTSANKACSAIPGARQIQVESILDGPKLKPLQLLVFTFCALVALLDGMDSQSIGVAAPVMLADLHVTKAQFTQALSAGLLGATIGALAFGSIADRLGRKPVLISATTLFGIFTLLTALPVSFASLLALRFIAGLGLGGATPCFITFAAEFAPSRHRTALTSFLWAAFPLGNAVGGFVSGYVVTYSTWHMVFLVAGVPTMVLAVLMLILLPESLRYMVARQYDPAVIERLARRLDPSIGIGPIEVVAQASEDLLSDEAGAGLMKSLGALFSDGRAIGTLLIWALLYLGFATTTLMVLMSPTLLASDDISLGLRGTLVGVFSISAMLGMAVAGRLMQMFGPVLALAPAYIIGGIFVALLGYCHDPILLGLCMVIIGLSAPLGVGGAVSLAATFYPTQIRSSGVGWGMGLGRFGQVCCPLAIGVMFSLSWGPAKILLVMAAAPLTAGLVLILLSWSLRPRRLRENQIPPRGILSNHTSKIDWHRENELEHHP
jgi:MFS transporter, AAHS family, 4-hydroxybenzoate transporter